jgi:hypothetical protein
LLLLSKCLAGSAFGRTLLLLQRRRHRSTDFPARRCAQNECDHRFDNAVSYVCPNAKPTGIRQIERIVHHIGIAVIALQVALGLDEGVGAHEAPYQWVIHPSVHVNQAHLVQVLAPGKAALGAQAVGGVGRAGGVPALALGVVGQAFDDFVCGQGAKVEKSKLGG